jgi:hypothetical protein
LALARPPGEEGADRGCGSGQPPKQQRPGAGDGQLEGHTDRQKVVVEHLAHRNPGSEALRYLKGGEGCHLHRRQASGELTERQLEG